MPKRAKADTAEGGTEDAGLRREGDYIVRGPLDKPERICRWIEIRRFIDDNDTQRVELEISFDCLGSTKTIRRPRSILTKQGILGLQEFGADTTESNWRDVLNWLNQQEARITKTYVHTGLGWAVFRGKKVFRHREGIGDDFVSEYAGRYDLGPVGTQESYTELVKREIVGHTGLEAWLAIGGTSALQVPLGLQETFFAHGHGDSSSGKTTALWTGVSLWGKPSPGEGSLIGTWATTSNALFGQLTANNGVALAFDEAGLREDGDFGRIIYAIASGQDKTRMDAKLKVDQPGQWHTSVMSSGELALTETSPTNGARVRLLELRTSVPFTKDAEHADRLKAGLAANYGTAGPKMVRYIMKMQEVELQRRHRALVDALETDLGTDPHFARRVAMKIAPVVLSAELLNEALGLNLHVEAILVFLRNALAEAADTRPIDERAYEFLMEAVTVYRRNFSLDQRQEMWGKIADVGGVRRLMIMKEPFKRLMREGSFLSPKAVIMAWKAKGLLKYEPGKTTTRVALVKGEDTPVYSVLVRPEYCSTVRNAGGSDEEGRASVEEHVWADGNGSDIGYTQERRPVGTARRPFPRRPPAVPGRVDSNGGMKR